MLSQFTFQNFKSYRDETVLDMQAISGQGFLDSLLCKDSKTELLPVSVIYGPNGGGKSNVLEALYSLVRLVSLPIKMFKGKISTNETKISPFLLDASSQNDPTCFEIYFRPSLEDEYRYNIKLKDQKIVEESLYRRKIIPHARTVMLFERNGNNIVCGSSIKKSVNKMNVNDQMPYFSFLSINYDIEPINLAAKWFENAVFVNYANPFFESGLLLSENCEFKKQLLSLLNDVEIRISDYTIEKKEDKKINVYFDHDVNGGKYTLPLSQESEGTKKLFSALPYVIVALNEGRMLIIDEFDAKLHPKLLKYIIMLFKNPEINKHNAQLIFTSHDVSTMKSSVFRTDEIWFACKKEDEASVLYSLYELRDEHGNRINGNAAYDKQYLEGRYGADPYFRLMQEWK